MTHLNPALDSLLIAEALKAASLEDICAELERRAKLCHDMAGDCQAFFRHEDDPVRREHLTHQSAMFDARGLLYADMAREGRRK